MKSSSCMCIFRMSIYSNILSSSYVVYMLLRPLVSQDCYCVERAFKNKSNRGVLDNQIFIITIIIAFIYISLLISD
jgi:hypothetical protein